MADTPDSPAAGAAGAAGAADAAPALAQPGTSHSLGAHSLIYLVGTALQGLGVLLILPFATRLLGPDEFGRVSTGLVAVQMVGTLAAAGLPQVILREHHRGADGSRAARALAGAMILLAAGVGAVGLVVALALAAAGKVELSEWLPLLVAAVALTTVVSGQTLMRARMRPWGFLLLAVGSTVLAQGAGLLAARSEPTAGTYLTAYAAVLVLVAGVAVVVGRPLPPTAARERVREGVRLAAPLLPQAVAMLGLLMGDVLLTRLLLGEAAAGSYQVALQLGNMPFVLAVALFNAWGPLVLSHPVGSRWTWTGRTGAALTTVVGFGAVGVALLGPWLVALMADQSFDRDAMVRALALVVTAAVSYMVYQGASLAVLDVERTGRLAWAALAALGVLVGVAVLLAPGAGIVGIAAAKAVGYLVLALLTALFARRHSPLRWPVAVPVVWTSAIVLAVLSGLLPSDGWGLWVRLALTVVVGGGALLVAPRILRILRG